MAMGSLNNSILSVSKAVLIFLPESDPRLYINLVLCAK